ncbi:MAG: sugar phosphate isomerase/epimerase family protein [Acidobacteriota bacterium]|nr:sugar phosphate isomerase/epimerase family protein [Acidobacteriota bacterium]
MPGPDIFISCLHYEWDTPEEALDRACNEFGLQGVEFSWPHPALDDACLPALSALASEMGLALSVHVWGDLARSGPNEGAKMLDEWLRICKLGGFGQMVLHGGSHDDQATGLAITRHVLQAAVPSYEAAGVVICLENHYAYTYHDSHELFSTPAEFLELFRQVESPCLRFLLDFGHSHMNGNTEKMLRELSPWMANTHLADNRGVDDDHLAFGQGTLPWEAVLALCRELGYTGPFTVEFPVREGTLDCFATCKDVIQRLQSQG